MTVIGTMKILVAPNSFKESLNSCDVARHIRIGLQRTSKKFHITELPLADGGTGTCRIITKALKGKFLKCRVTGPLDRKVWATYGIISKQKTAVIELAEAAGLHIVPRNKRNPMLSNTIGVGELMLHAINNGCKKIILGIGDSATIDCGIGALSVLGIRFLDQNNKHITVNCKGLLNLANIDTAKLNKKLTKTKIIIASDVENVLTGRNGALVYAKQKGATRKMVPIIDKALKNFKKIILRQYGIDLDSIPGSGAAGGIGGAMKVLLNAEIKSGFEIIEKIIYLERRIIESDLIITGEGRIDKQSFYGKTIKRVVDMAKIYNKPIILIAGSVTKEANLFYNHGVIDIYNVLRTSISLKNSIEKTATFLEDLSFAIGEKIRRWLTSNKY